VKTWLMVIPSLFLSAAADPSANRSGKTPTPRQRSGGRFSRPAALRGFAETARAGSLAGASRVLNVTPSAVSHLLRELEQSLALTLFLTRGPNARLTETGERLGRRLVVAFDAIEAAITEARHEAGEVRVSALSSFLTLWLVPRLTGFQARHADIRLLFSTGIRPVDLSAEPFDCAIRWGRGPWPDLNAMLLFRDDPVVVTNPRLAGTESLPRLAARTRPEDWRLVAAALGWPDTPAALTFETRALAVQAATAGMGAAETAPNPPVPTEEGHWFVALPDRLRIRQVQRFRDWLVTEAAAAQTPRLQRGVKSP
jgi:LysR family transcriptional regulator, glycine cleavage system transcriptional activator